MQKEVGGLQDALQYFAQEKGFDRLIRAMFDVYARHGRAFGAVRLTRPGAEEEKAISTFFKRDYYNQALIRIGLADFERQMQKMFEADLRLDAVLEGYTGRQIRSDVRTGKNSDRFTASLLTELAPRYENTPAATWLMEMISHMRRTYRPWVEMYQENPSFVLEIVDAVASALNNIPESGLTRLGEFSGKHTGSPYALDYYDMHHGQLFLRALAHRFGMSIPYNAEDGLSLYLRAGLLAGGVLSRVTVYGLNANDEATTIYDNLNEAFVLTLENLSRLSSAQAYGGKVFILENPQVYAAVYERLRGTKCTIVCPMGGGMPAFTYLMKLLLANGATLYYAGNLDYKGLLAADKLYLELGKSFVPWRYEREDYERILGETEALLPDEKKGLAMHNDVLASLLSHMRKVGKTASSMPLVPLLVEDIKIAQGAIPATQ